MSNPGLLLKLFTGSKIECNNSVVGANFTQTLTGDTYNAGYYKNSNAIRIPAAIAGGEDFKATENTPVAGTIEMWVRFQGWSMTNANLSDGGHHKALYRDSLIVPFNALFFQQGNGFVSWVFGDSGFTAINVTNQSIADNTWTHIAQAYSIADDVHECLINGVVVGSSTMGTTVLAGTNASVQSIGMRATNNDMEFDGDIDGVTFYNYRKTAQEIKKTMNDRRSGLMDVVE